MNYIILKRACPRERSKAEWHTSKKSDKCPQRKLRASSLPCSSIDPSLVGAENLLLLYIYHSIHHIQTPLHK